MTDDEILRGVGLNELLDNMDHMFTKGRVLKAMEQARDDERDQTRAMYGQVAQGKTAADYVVNGFPKIDQQIKGQL